MADLFERAAAEAGGTAAPASRARAAETPTREELRHVPWSGDGPDPLEQLWERS